MSRKNPNKRPKMEDFNTSNDEIVQLISAALSGRTRDVQIVAHRIAKQSPDSQRAKAIAALLSAQSDKVRPLRRHIPPMPLDQDSRLELLRVESPVELEHEPVFSRVMEQALSGLLEEHRNAEALQEKGLYPTRTALFTGMPGVGKTFAARWFARELGLPLLTLDLSAVMSSFLGRTGGNVRAVLDYAKNIPSVLLLDEFDAVAKRRDDAYELGELKRLVTVLLQEIDNWPNDRLLIAATNHAELLDPAVWRRFELKLDFEPLEEAMIESFTRELLTDESTKDHWFCLFSTVFSGQPHHEIEHLIKRARRDVALGRETLDEALGHVIASHARSLESDQRQRIAMIMVNDIGVSQRFAHKLTGVSRDTLRKKLHSLSNAG